MSTLTSPSASLFAAANPQGRFAQDGFVLHPEPVLSPDLIARAIQGMDALHAGEYETGRPPQPSIWNPGDSLDKLIKIEMPQLANRAIWDVVSHAGIGELAARITGAKFVQVWWVQHLVKPSTLPGATATANIGWHQDRNYWQVWEEGSELFTAWIALTDVTEEAGAMRFLRGSHRWGLQTSDFYGQDHDLQRETIQIPTGQRWEDVPAVLRPGGVSFHHHLTYHASGPNHSGAPRRSFALHMRTERSAPVDGLRKGLTQFIDAETKCPVVYRA
jgi:hypothetical protein